LPVLFERMIARLRAEAARQILKDLEMLHDTAGAATSPCRCWRRRSRSIGC
jgi:hypothetical protein